MQNFEGKVVFITGGSSGIGLGIAKAFGRVGAKLMLAARTVAALEEAVAGLRSANVQVEGVVTDVADLSSVEHAAKETLRRFGGVDIVVNNAGVSLASPIETWTEQNWRWVIDVNLMGVVHGIQVFAPLLRERKAGHIVNTASLAGLAGGPYSAQYVATKFAVVGLSQSVRAELEGEGIGVSVLCPGFIRTNIASSSRHAPISVAAPKRFGEGLTGAAGEFVKYMLEGVERGLDPERVGEMVREAVTENAFYIFPDTEFEPHVEAVHEQIRAGWARARARPSA